MIANYTYSHSSQVLVLPGPLISPYPMLPRMLWMFDQLRYHPIFDYYDTTLDSRPEYESVKVGMNQDQHGWEAMEF